LDLGFLVDDVMSGVCFAFLLMTSSSIRLIRYSGSRFYCILGYNTSLHCPWSTFLVPKLRPKKQNVYKNLGEFARNSRINIRLFWHNFSTRSATKSIKPSKDSYYSLESKQTLSHKTSSIGRLPGSDDITQM